MSQSKFKKFVNVIDAGLQKSHEAIDTIAIIEECYGEDAAIFADSKAEGNNLLVGLLDAALDKIDEDVKKVGDALAQEEAESKLNNLDEAIAQINRKEETAKEAEEYDRQSAQDALRMSKIPDGISIYDIMAYQAYLIKKEARDALIAQVDAAREAKDELAKQVEERKDLVKARIQGLDERNKTLDKAADVCSFSGVS